MFQVVVALAAFIGITTSTTDKEIGDSENTYKFNPGRMLKIKEIDLDRNWKGVYKIKGYKSDQSKWSVVLNPEDVILAAFNLGLPHPTGASVRFLGGNIVGSSFNIRYFATEHSKSKRKELAQETLNDLLGAGAKITLMRYNKVSNTYKQEPLPGADVPSEVQSGGGGGAGAGAGGGGGAQIDTQTGSGAQTVQQTEAVNQPPTGGGNGATTGVSGGGGTGAAGSTPARFADYGRSYGRVYDDIYDDIYDALDYYDDERTWSDYVDRLRQNLQSVVPRNRYRMH